MGRVVAAAIIALFIAGGFYASQHQPPIDLKIHELSVKLPVNNRTYGYTYGTQNVLGYGTVAFVSSPKLAPLEDTCQLGAFYRLKKQGFEQYRTRWSEESLQTAAQASPPTVKEFNDSYLVFEPSQAVCSSDPARESELRGALLTAVAKAESTGPAQ
jgi:hypothetical protein